MNLPDKPLSKFKGALVIDMTILIFESKKEVGHSKHRNKKNNRKTLYFDF